MSNFTRVAPRLPPPRPCALGLVGLLALSSAAQAAPGAPARVVFWENTKGNHPHVFDRTDPRLLERLPDPLGAVCDFVGAPGECYDVYASDRDGTPNPDGDFFTIDAVYGYAMPYSGGHNISAVVAIDANAHQQRATIVTHAVAHGDNADVASAHNAVDDDPDTTTALGNTVGFPGRLSLTVGFPPPKAPAGTTMGSARAPTGGPAAPPQTVNTPTQTVNTPTQTVNTPAQTVNTPAQTVNTPAQTVNTPAQTVTTPAQTVTTPPQTVNTPVHGSATPAAGGLRVAGASWVGLTFMHVHCENPAPGDLSRGNGEFVLAIDLDVPFEVQRARLSEIDAQGQVKPGIVWDSFDATACVIGADSDEAPGFGRNTQHTTTLGWLPAGRSMVHIYGYDQGHFLTGHWFAIDLITGDGARHTATMVVP